MKHIIKERRNKFDFLNNCHMTKIHNIFIKKKEEEDEEEETVFALV